MHHPPAIARHYYQQAIRLRPYDAQLRSAMGEAALACDDMQCAVECFLLAETLGDVEGGSSRRLGQLYRKMGDVEKAAYFDRRYLQKKKFVISDDDTYLPAIALCKYYKEKWLFRDFRRICDALLAANDEVEDG